MKLSIRTILTFCLAIGTSLSAEHSTAAETVAPLNKELRAVEKSCEQHAPTLYIGLSLDEIKLAHVKTIKTANDNNLQAKAYWESNTDPEWAIAVEKFVMDIVNDPKNKGLVVIIWRGDSCLCCYPMQLRLEPTLRTIAAIIKKGSSKKPIFMFAWEPNCTPEAKTLLEKTATSCHLLSDFSDSNVISMLSCLERDFAQHGLLLN